jgi:hypothetical protein
MFENKARTVREYLENLSPDQRASVEPVLGLVRKHLPKGYREEMSFGAIGWVVPLDVYPTTYNGQPLCYAALAVQKNYVSLYLMNAYASKSLQDKLKTGFRAAGKKLDMGKACIRFKAPADLALDVIADVVGATPMMDYITGAEKIRTRTKESRRQAAPARSSAKKKPTVKKKK